MIACLISTYFPFVRWECICVWVWKRANMGARTGMVRLLLHECHLPKWICINERKLIIISFKSVEYLKYIFFFVKKKVWQNQPNIYFSLYNFYELRFSLLYCLLLLQRLFAVFTFFYCYLRLLLLLFFNLIWNLKRKFPSIVKPHTTTKDINELN